MSIWIVASISLVISFIVFKVFMKFSKATCRCQVDLTGKTALVTGSDKGIGYYTALSLAQRNARVILACRNLESAQLAAREIQSKTGNENVVPEYIDLSSFRSVRNFAEKINLHESRIDILINNAGMADVSNTRTEDGLLLIIATNYIGPFLLTHLLLDKLKQSAPSRIVNVASIAHKWCRQLDLTNLNAEKCLDPRSIYSISKLALVTYTSELARRLEGTGVTVNSLHPGTVNTNLFSKIPQPFAFLCGVISKIFFRTPEEGAQTSIHVAISDELKDVSGKYFSECKIARPSIYSYDEGVAKKLYERSEFYAQLK